MHDQQKTLLNTKKKTFYLRILSIQLCSMQPEKARVAILAYQAGRTHVLFLLKAHVEAAPLRYRTTHATLSISVYIDASFLFIFPLVCTNFALQ